MKQFYSPKEIDYSRLIEFLYELDATFSDNPLDNSDINFAFHLKLSDEKTNVELIQYGKYCMSFSITLILDGDCATVESFLRAFNEHIVHYTPLGDIAKKLADIPKDIIPYKYDTIRDQAFKFRGRISALLGRAEKLYEEKRYYHDFC